MFMAVQFCNWMYCWCSLMVLVICIISSFKRGDEISFFLSIFIYVYNCVCIYYAYCPVHCIIHPITPNIKSVSLGLSLATVSVLVSKVDKCFHKNCRRLIYVMMLRFLSRGAENLWLSFHYWMLSFWDTSSASKSTPRWINRIWQFTEGERAHGHNE